MRREDLRVVGTFIVFHLLYMALYRGVRSLNVEHNYKEPIMNLYTPILITAGFVISSFTMAAPPADDLLAGPSIEAEEVTSQDMTDRVLKEQSKSKKVGSRQQSQMWRTALKVIDLTKDQEMEIHKIMEEFQNLNQIFRATHGKEIRSIRAEHDKKRDVLTTILIGAPKDQAAISEASKKRMLELMEIAPDVKTYQEKAWVLLSAEQQALFQTQYQALIEEAKKEAAEKQDKNNRSRRDRPMMDDMEEGGFAPKDSKFRDRTVDPMDDPVDRHDNALDGTSLKRIKFLRRLQNLKKD